MENTKWDSISRRAAFESVTKNDVLEFVQKLTTQGYLQMLVQGNFYQNEAKQFFKTAISTLKGKTVHDSRAQPLN